MPRPRPRRRARRRAYDASTPITDEEIARAQSVEHIDGVGAVQPLTIGQSFTLLSSGERIHGSSWYAPDGSVNWARLENVGVLEVRENPANDNIDERYVDITGVIANHITNTPDYYDWQYVVASKNFQAAKDEATYRVLTQYDNKVSIDFLSPYVDAMFRREEANEPGAVMLQEAYDAYNAHVDNFRQWEADRDAATDLRELEAAESAWNTALSLLWSKTDLQP